MLAEPSFLQYERALQMHKAWLNKNDSSDKLSDDVLGQKVSGLYYQAMRAMRDKVSSSLSQYDLHAMCCGILILWVVSFVY